MNSNRTAEVWKVIRDVTENKNYETPAVEVISKADEKIEDPNEIANEFNQFFVGVGDRFPKLGDSNKALYYLKNIPTQDKTFCFKQVSSQNVWGRKQLYNTQNISSMENQHNRDTRYSRLCHGLYCIYSQHIISEKSIVSTIKNVTIAVAHTLLAVKN